jgi:hypothetical protein
VKAGALWEMLATVNPDTEVEVQVGILAPPFCQLKNSVVVQLHTLRVASCEISAGGGGVNSVTLHARPNPPALGPSDTLSD